MAVDGGGGDGDGDGDGDDGADGNTTGAPPTDDLLEIPKIVDPAGDELTIPSDRVQPVELGVGDIVPGRTQVLLDGVAIIVAGQPSSRGSLTSDTLTLEVNGALATGSHDVELLTAGSSFPLKSRRVFLRVSAASPVTPVVGAPSLISTPPYEAMVIGSGAIGLLSTQDATTMRLDVVPTSGSDDINGGQFDFAARKSVLLPRLVTGANPGAGLCLALVPGKAPVPTDDVALRVAWRLDAAPRNVAVHESAWSDIVDDSALTPTIELTLPADATLGKESVHIDGLACADTALLVAATSHADAETPAPGDASVFLTAWYPQGEIMPLVRLPGGLGIDLTDLEVVMKHPPRNTAIELLVQGVLTRQYELVDNSLALSVVPIDLQRTGPLLSTSATHASIRGALNSRQTIEVRPASTLLHVLDESQISTKTSTANGIPATPTPVTAAIASTVLSGRALFVVPHGSATPSTILRTNGNVATATEGPACEAVALAPNAAAAASTSLLCLRQGAVSVQTVSLAPP